MRVWCVHQEHASTHTPLPPRSLTHAACLYNLLVVGPLLCPSRRWHYFRIRLLSLALAGRDSSLPNRHSAKANQLNKHFSMLFAFSLPLPPCCQKAFSKYVRQQHGFLSCFAWHNKYNATFRFVHVVWDDDTICGGGGGDSSLCITWYRLIDRQELDRTSLSSPPPVPGHSAAPFSLFFFCCVLPLRSLVKTDMKAAEGKWKEGSQERKWKAWSDDNSRMVFRPAGGFAAGLASPGMRNFTPPHYTWPSFPIDFITTLPHTPHTQKQSETQCTAAWRDGRGRG